MRVLDGQQRDVENERAVVALHGVVETTAQRAKVLLAESLKDLANLHGLATLTVLKRIALHNPPQSVR